MRTPEQVLKEMLGQLSFQVAVLTAKVEELQDRLTSEKKTEESDSK